MTTDYERIASAIRYLQTNVLEQPSLEQVARATGLSSAHFQRLFKRWAGVSPKRYLQYLTVEHAKAYLKDSNVLETAYAAGLSSSSRLYEHFLTVEAITPGQYKQAGAGLELTYGVADSVFGSAWLASTPHGICALEFLDANAEQDYLQRLQERWPKAHFNRSDKAVALIVTELFIGQAVERPLHLLGSNFQIQVWKALLDIPFAELTSYKQVANAIGKPNSSRAVARAIGSNSIGYLIPCHRVLRGTGELSGYRWGVERKAAILAWEGIKKKIYHEDTKITK